MAFKSKPAPERKILLGIMGERIVAQHLRKLGHDVEESLNVFDSEKDMLVDGLPVEVKTQVPIMVEDSFGIAPSQKAKIYTCHRVYFISVPLKGHDELAGCVYEMDPRDESLKAHRWSTHAGREMIFFTRRQKAMKHIFTIDNEDILEQLRKLSTSYL
jgi:hypothetical protein